MHKFKDWLRKKIWAFLGNSLDKKLEKYTIHTLKVRDEIDIKKIAEQLSKLQARKATI